MRPEPKKRPRRVPFTKEEVARLIAIKKRKEHIRLHTFKASLSYKLQNTFTIVCFFIFWELLFCFFGPVNYQKHYSYSFEAKLGHEYDKNLKPIVSELEFKCVGGQSFKLIVEEFKELPPKYTSFMIGSDFILHKPLKARYGNNQTSYRLFSASPLLLLILLSLITCIVGYTYNLNETAHSLMAMNVLNALTLLGVMIL